MDNNDGRLPEEQLEPESAPATPPETEANTAAEASEPEPTIADWQAALETAVKQRDDYLLMARRAQADFANFKRRNATVRADAYDDGVRETLSAMLITLDNLERALGALDEATAATPLADGLLKTLKQFRASAEKLGMEEIPALGEKFDPEVHNAVMRATGGEPGTVLEVFEKGYKVKGRIIRYASVKVAAE